jgi:hypothetical protein
LADRHDQEYVVEEGWKSGAPEKRIQPTDCNGCEFDPTYEELKQGAICKTTGCVDQSKHSRRMTVCEKQQKGIRG